MAKPVLIRKVVVEFSMQSLNVLRDALTNYHKYLQDNLTFENQTILTKSTIKKRIRYLEDFVEDLEVERE